MDYRVAIENCLRVYGSNAVLLVKSLQTLIETSIENERARLRAEAVDAAALPVCRQCNQALEQTKAEIEAGRRAERLIQAGAAERHAEPSQGVRTVPEIAAPPLKRGRGRPKGSKNKPKVADV